MAPLSRMEVEHPDVHIHSRDQLPALSTGAYEVWYVEQIIADLGVIGQLLQSYHSGLVFRPVDQGGARRAGKGTFTLQYYAVDFPNGALVPKGIDDAGLPVWNNAAVIAYTDGYDTERWTKDEQMVGCAASPVLEKFFDWVIDDYTPKHPGYQLFDVWDRAMLTAETQIFCEGCVCDVFTHKGLRQLHTLGAKMTIETPLYRNYVPLLTATKPETIDLHDASQLRQLSDFYSSLNELIGKGLSGKSFSQFLHWIADRFEFWYIYNSVDKSYIRVSLTAPFISPKDWYQRMELQWQPASDRHNVAAQAPVDSKMDAANFIATFKAGVGELMQKRGTPLLKEKMRAPGVALAAALLASLVSSIGGRYGVVVAALVSFLCGCRSGCSPVHSGVIGGAVALLGALLSHKGMGASMAGFGLGTLFGAIVVTVLETGSAKQKQQ